MKAGLQDKDKQLLFFGLWCLLSVAVFWKPCLDLVRFSLSNDHASHVLLIPLITGWLIYTEQKKVFQNISINYSLALVPFAFATAVSLWTLRNPISWAPGNQLAAYVTALVLFWISGFIFFFGGTAARNARFALLLLFMTVPLPEFLLNYVIYGLQKGSADIAEMIFDLAGVPALREGFVFHLAHVNIEVAKECSGIRSSLALLILALLVGHLLLKTFWKQAAFVLAGLVIMMVKNGVRIATLTILAQYVDPSFLFGRLHHDGGIVFFLLGLVLLLPILWLLERSEKPAERMAKSPAA